MMLYITVLFSPSRSAAPLLKTFLTKIPKSAPRADLPPAIFIPCNKNKKTSYYTNYNLKPYITKDSYPFDP